MAYIVKKKIYGKEYFYLVKNIRIDRDRWKKHTIYIGKHKPTDRKIQLLTAKLEKEAVLPKLTYLTELEAEELQDVRDTFFKKYNKLGKLMKEKVDRDFLIRFTYNTNAIEGNTLTLRETAMLLEEKRSPANKDMREIYEAQNMEKCYNFMKEYKKKLDEKFIFTLHKKIMEKLGMHKDVVGKYRKGWVRITGTTYEPTKHYKIKSEIDKMFKWYKENKNKLHPAELGALIHLKFVSIHPFQDGNGRVARLINNFILIENKFPPIYIKNKQRKDYYNALDQAQLKGNDKPFVKFVVKTLKEEYLHVL